MAILLKSNWQIFSKLRWEKYRYTSGFLILDKITFLKWSSYLSQIEDNCPPKRTQIKSVEKNHHNCFILCCLRRIIQEISNSSSYIMRLMNHKRLKLSEGSRRYYNMKRANVGCKSYTVNPFFVTDLICSASRWFLGRSQHLSTALAATD